MKTSKEMTNLEIKELLKDVAAALKLKDEKKNRFRIIAYERAADAVEHLSSEAKDLFDEGKLEDVGGIGENIAKHLGEIFEKGESKHFNSILRGIPESVFELMKIPGIGAKRAYFLSKALNLKKKPIEELEKLAKEGKVEGLEGMGKDTQEAILQSIKEVKGRKARRLLLPYAEKISQGLVSWMKKEPAVKEIEVLGSLIRKVSTVGDIDLAVATDEGKKVLTHFTKYPKSKRVLDRGDKKASIILPGDIQIDLMVTTPNSFGSLLQHFTGSKHHNISLREYAKGLKKPLSLSEYGVRKVISNKSKVQSKNEELIKFKTEKEFYKFLGLEWIPPEIREDWGEIEAAKENKIPKLVNLEDVKGDLQIHSDFDIETSHDLGLSTMTEVVKKANNLGYEYIAFTEHNPSQSGHSDKQIIEILKKKKEAVEKLNNDLPEGGPLKGVFNSLEIDILPNGNLPVSDRGLELLDFALVSIHSSFRQSRAKQTQRILRALSNPK